MRPKFRSLIIPIRTRKIKDYEYQNNLDFDLIVFPRTVKEIGKGAFKGCKFLKDLYLPKDLKTIGEEAFYDCDSLRSIRIPPSVTSIGTNAFKNTILYFNIEAYKPYMLRNDWCPHCIKVYNYYQDEVISDDFIFALCKEDEEIYITVVKYIGNKEDVIIPETIDIEMFFDNVPVKKIANLAFKEAKIKSIVMPNTITEIGEEAFYKCEKLEKVKLSSLLKYIPDKAFYGCSLKEIELPSSIEYIGKMAFTGNKFKEITLPIKTLFIDEEAFLMCTLLEEINLNEGLNLIGENAFRGCKALSYIDLPSSLIQINCYAFSKCTSLTSIFIPSNVKVLKERVLSECWDLIIYCESRKGERWSEEWNYSKESFYYGSLKMPRSEYLPVYYNVSKEEYLEQIKAFVV